MRKNNWGEDRVLCYNAQGRLCSVLASWTSLALPIHARALAHEIKEEFGLAIHPRSIERALARKKKP